MDRLGTQTLEGVFVGYHLQPGEIWSGDYLVAELDPFKENPDAERKDVRVHRIKEVYLPDGDPQFPVAAIRKSVKPKATDADIFLPEPIPQEADPEQFTGLNPTLL